MFEGEVPNEGVFKNISAFSVVGNKNLCGGIQQLRLPSCPQEVPESRRNPSTRRVIILVTSISLPSLLVLACVGAILYHSRKSKQQIPSAATLSIEYPKLSYAELFQATDGFSSRYLIGEGRYGSVYKGIINPGEQTIAVKVINLQHLGADKSFMAECEALRNTRHRNLVKIFTSCSSINFKGTDFKALVFEFMPNGSLESWLHPSSSEQQESKKLNLVQRLNIAIDVASAFDYLHHDCETPIIHCDLKPGNVLVDEDLCAHVGDFGLARFLSATTQTSSTTVKGTVGYVAPEYGMGGRVSMQGDVYSYGMLLLEMITGKRPTATMFGNNLSLHTYVKMALPNRVMEIADPSLILEEENKPDRTTQSSSASIAKMEECLVSLLHLCVMCSAESPSERMGIKGLLKDLHGLRHALLG